MPPKKGAKRAAPTNGATNGASKKPKVKSSDPLREPHPFYQESEENGIVLRKFYPHEMSNARARAYNSDELPRPIELLNSAMADTVTQRKKVAVKDAVVHWFKMDLRTADNRALSLAGEKAKEAGVPLIALYIVSPQDFEAHLTSAPRVNFMLRTLDILRADLAKLDIPLYVETIEKRKTIPKRIVDLMQEWGASHLFANMEYEVDELRREADMVRTLAEKGLSFEVVHDTCVVPPGSLTSGSGKPYAVYSPWYRSYVVHLQDNPELLEVVPPPAKNAPAARKKFAKLFSCKIPNAPNNKSLSAEEAMRYEALWPPGEHEAQKRLDMFCEEKVGTYAAKRNFPAEVGTSSISVHLSSGTLSARMAIRTARDRNKTKKLNAGNEGIQTWIGEVAWRDFYKHVLVHWPYVCMNKPFKPEYSNIEWSYDQEHFKAWTEGRTGFPIVDAAMRQLTHVGWMHNRCRMIVASFLSKDLLIDWRMGERFFMEHLVDGDFASNNGGWGFAASVGVDPQPYFRIFNPLLQSEKFDADGEYIRKWVPELKGIEGKAIHDPYGRGAGAQAKKKGYPEPIVEHKGSRERALTAYKKGIESDM
ncbi:putative deoxyribodipyrimidine photo-lyase protein [Phaeoacremonium minimum UCRPA7]|uniref:Putative deoxyribodipyrimidine photo-lyase protein n=1 Tax=Phaeoacremonium minimum (strain UCR-PA7) TaxID=1286976 RepID=R8B9D1_PHAM7|nr:putative deoxyribodipyrimidine photo-lyase protein [Phaeoacremonium minimum UCRPA7]EON95901.1 putative deoxyribodipyrimidine photo-lyase protein [Phaeoacremonium minimum UCRPA7]